MSRGQSIPLHKKELSRRAVILAAVVGASLVRKAPVFAQAVSEETVTIDDNSGFSGFLARPSARGQYPGVLVLHDLEFPMLLLDIQAIRWLRSFSPNYRHTVLKR